MTMIGRTATLGFISGLLLSLAMPSFAAEKKDGKADELDSEHIFGFTEGSDIGEKGEKEGEIEPLMRFGKRTGTYFAHSTAFLYKYSLSDDFRVAPMFALSSHSISGVPGLEDRHSFDFEGAGAEIRYRLLNRDKAPFGATLSFEPMLSRVAPLGGERVREFSAGFSALIDKELIPKTLFGAVNLGYEPAWTKVKASDLSASSAALAFSGALSTQVHPGVVVGMEVRYERAYEGAGLDTLQGDALFVGPSAFFKLTDKAFFSAAWSAQVSGHAVGETGSLDLTNFERNQVRLRFGMALD